MSYATSPEDAKNVGMIKKRLTTLQTSTSATPAKVTGLDQATGIGTFVFSYFIRYRSTATANGVRFDVNHTGTVTSFVWNQRWVDTSSTASTAAPDQNEILAAGAVMGSFASRAKGTAGRGTTLSVDTVDVDMFMLIEGLMVVTVAGNLELYFGGETATSCTIEADTVLTLTEVP